MTVTPESLRIRRKKRREELQNALEQILSQLQEMGALKIILFGSFALGTLTRWSDLDLLVVMPSNKSGKEWFQDIYNKINVEVGFDILPFTEEELRQKRKYSSFINSILEEGQLIYEKG